MKRKYTASDRQYLKDNYKTMTVQQMADALGRTPASVFVKCKGMGLEIIDGRGRPPEWHGCDETCPDYCPYPDCYKP